MTMHILLNVLDEHEMRVAVVRDRRLEQLIHERQGEDLQSLGNIYKCKVSNVEPSLDAAFVDLGGAKNGFLHIDEVRHNRGGNARIEDVLRPGDELIVQVTKESIRDKGPCLTTYLSIPGRNLVLVQSRECIGVSKKIEDPGVRRRLKRLLSGFEAPEGFGFIVRTAGADRSDEELTLDYEFLKRLWTEISERNKQVRAPACLYREADMVMRTLRELASAEIESVVIDSEQCYDEARAFAMVFMPEIAGKIQLHREELPIFTFYGVEDRLATMFDRRVELPSGGNVVIEQTEAMVSIDVNSAKNREGGDVAQTALQTNLEAVQVIAEQLILRDLGGLIIIDFIDMENREHQRIVQLALRRTLLRDKARTQVAVMSRFGLVEMTRQRTRPSQQILSSTECPYCKGTGEVTTPEAFAIACMRAVRDALAKQTCGRLEVSVPQELAVGLLNERHEEIAGLEKQYDTRIVIVADQLMKAREYRINGVQGRKTTRRQQGKPIHPGLLASWLEIKARELDEARRLMEAGSAAIEKEIDAILNGEETKANGNGVAKPLVPAKEVAPPQVVETPAPAPEPIPVVVKVEAPRMPTLWEDAGRLRELLFRFQGPQSVAIVVQAPVQTAPTSNLASRPQGAKQSPPAHKGDAGRGHPSRKHRARR